MCNSSMKMENDLPLGYRIVKISAKSFTVDNASSMDKEMTASLVTTVKNSVITQYLVGD